MRVRDVRSWQWMIAGLLCGLAVGVARVGWGPGYQDEVSRTLPQPLFEHGVTSSSGSAFHLSELLIHPPDGDGATWVTGQLREQSQDEHGSPTIRAEPFKFRATVPYRPGVALDFAGSPSEVTVEDYLAQIASRVPQAQVRFRYAWEERPPRRSGSALQLAWS